MILKRLYSFSICLLFLGISVSAQQNIPPRLSPRPIEVESVSKAVVSLNGHWDFSIKGEKKKSKILVPGEWEMQGYEVADGETVVYSREIVIPGNWKNKRVKIRFDGVSSHAVVKLNGEIVTEHEGSFVPFEADMTKLIKAGSNLLTVEVQALTISDILACTSQYAAHTVGGILRKAMIFALPDVNIADVAITTVFDKQYKDAVLVINTSIANESK